MGKFRKKPVVIEARQLHPGRLNEWEDWIGESFAGFSFDHIKIQTLEGVMKANIGDWIIKGVNGEFYPCKDEIFRKTYDPVEGES